MHLLSKLLELLELHLLSKYKVGLEVLLYPPVKKGMLKWSNLCEQHYKKERENTPKCSKNAEKT